MSAKHTPGPWWIAGKGTVRHGDTRTGGWVADVHWRNRAANARLIAAAPRLLDTGAAALRLLRELGKGDTFEAMALADAIREAGGEP